MRGRSCLQGVLLAKREWISVEVALRKLLQDRRGATAIEYGLIAALISIACIIAFNSLGLNLADLFNLIADTIAV
jgi:pilus assembly protein Flp/PilA